MGRKRKQFLLPSPLYSLFLVLGDPVLRNSYNPARWFKQIKRTVSFDVTRFNPNQQSTAKYNHIFNGRNTTINDQLSTKLNDQLKHSKYTVVFPSHGLA